MQKSRLAAWQQRGQVHAEVPDSEHISKRTLLASLHPAEEGLRIVRRLGPERGSRSADRQPVCRDGHDCASFRCNRWTRGLHTATLESPRNIAAERLHKRTSAMNWDDLRILAAVHECGTYAAASKALGLDETTVGRRLSRLEASLGMKLLDAVDGRRRPTRAAQGLLRHLEAMTRPSRSNEAPCR